MANNLGSYFPDREKKKTMAIMMTTMMIVMTTANINMYYLD